MKTSKPKHRGKKKVRFGNHSVRAGIGGTGYAPGLAVSLRFLIPRLPCASHSINIDQNGQAPQQAWHSTRFHGREKADEHPRRRVPRVRGQDQQSTLSGSLDCLLDTGVPFETGLTIKRAFIIQLVPSFGGGWAASPGARASPARQNLPRHGAPPCCCGAIATQRCCT